MWSRFSLILALAMLVGCSRGRILRAEWTTMDTCGAVQMRDGDDRLLALCRDRAVAICAQIENLLNAFDPESELSHLAKKSDAEVLATCDAGVRECYAAAFTLRDRSGSVFNPRWRGTNTLDLGAIAKGFAVDRICSALAELDLRGAEVLVDLGGNLKSLRGKWRTGIYGSDEVIVLTDGMACATSAEYFRGHHIADGRTGEAAVQTAFSVTVTHPSSAMLADGLSTALFIFGHRNGDAFLKTAYPEAAAHWIGSGRGKP